MTKRMADRYQAVSMSGFDDGFCQLGWGTGKVHDDVVTQLMHQLDI
jgi:hypothetical protein